MGIYKHMYCISVVSYLPFVLQVESRVLISIAVTVPGINTIKTFSLKINQTSTIYLKFFHEQSRSYPLIPWKPAAPMCLDGKALSFFASSSYVTESNGDITLELNALPSSWLYRLGLADAIRPRGISRKQRLSTAQRCLKIFFQRGQVHIKKGNSVW